MEHYRQGEGLLIGVDCTLYPLLARKGEEHSWGGGPPDPLHGGSAPLEPPIQTVAFAVPLTQAAFRPKLWGALRLQRHTPARRRGHDAAAFKLRWRGTQKESVRKERVA